MKSSEQNQTELGEAAQRGDDIGKRRIGPGTIFTITLNETP